MIKPVQFNVFVSVLSVFIASLSINAQEPVESDKLSPSDSRETTSRFIDSHKQVLRCFWLTLNQQVEVSFSSSEPVEFFVELQSDESSTQVIGKHLTHKMKGLIVTAKSNGQHCFIWRNPQNKAVKFTTSFYRED